jgi:hypothetical protein
MDKCEATGIPFDNSYEGTFINMNPYAPSIDRIDSNKEYTIDNCRLVLTAFNSLKSTLSDYELYTHLKQFVNYYENNSAILKHHDYYNIPNTILIKNHLAKY